MRGIDYRRLRSQLSMRVVLELLGYTPSRIKGSQWRGNCPLPSCRDRHCNFSVHLEKKAYRCFTCGSRGNVLDLWAQVHELPLYQAALHVCRELGIPVPFHSSITQRANRTPPNHNPPNQRHTPRPRNW